MAGWVNWGVMSLFTHIASYDQPFEAQFYAGMLHDAGIDAVLENENQVTIGMGWGNALGGVRLLVPTMDVERALQILATPPDELSGESTPDNF